MKAEPVALNALEGRPLVAVDAGCDDAAQVLARCRAVLTVVEVALSIVLIVGAGLFLKSFATIMGMDLGFRTDNVLAMNINLPEPRYASADDRFRFFDDLERRVDADRQKRRNTKSCNSFGAAEPMLEK